MNDVIEFPMGMTPWIAADKAGFKTDDEFHATLFNVQNGDQIAPIQKVCSVGIHYNITLSRRELEALKYEEGDKTVVFFAIDEETENGMILADVNHPIIINFDKKIGMVKQVRRLN